MKRICPPFTTALALILVGGPGLSLAAERPVSFAQEIRPLLSNVCFKCHGPDPEDRKGGPKGSGGLRLDTEAGSRMDLGGKAAVVPGHPGQSDLIARILSTDPDEVMPPPRSGKQLSASEKQRLADWVKEGAGFSRHWSYEPPVRLEPPYQGMHPVDSFVRERLDREGLQPQPEADRPTLARRLSFDLIGLPPSPGEVDAFVNDPSPDAYEKLADRLLASPAYGEHQARAWLDLARYADSAGYADDPPRPIWAFRDYVIRSFNSNKPFDQFTVEQLAGDLLPEPTEDQRIATAFHRNTMTNSEGGTNDEEFRNAAVVDRVNTTMAVWMGSSMACAQCHTHKYDPITQADYFRMFAILNNTADADLRDEAPLLHFLTEEQKTQQGKLQTEVDAVKAAFKSPTPAAAQEAAAWAEQFPLQPAWQTLIPASLKSIAGLPMNQEPDGTIAVTGSALKDTYLLEIPAASARSIRALRLEAIPHEGLPGNGPGQAAGNFVLTGLKLAVLPAGDTNLPMARYVRLELPGKNKFLQLAEVGVFSQGRNIAMEGTASQKSTYANALASRAIDGNMAGEFNKGSVAHTAENTDDPWWEVDLKASQPIDRIVVWNRAEAAERLQGFRLTALDEQRRPVWEKSGNAAAPVSTFKTDGASEKSFSDAVADYTQADFEARAVLNSPLPKDRKPGWAVGGSTGQAHTLTLLAADPVEVPAGARLQITLEQQSAFPQHTLGRFRLSTTSDAAVARLFEIPAQLASQLAKPAAARTAEESRQIMEHYLRERSPAFAAERRKLTDLTTQLAAITPQTVPVFQELPPEKRRRTHLQIRGNYQNHGEEVTGGMPDALFPLKLDGAVTRLALARWLMDPQNPLTARVTANRYWESLFGVGIVRTSEEFGAQGELPSHPELLDWLATELVREKWDIKKFVRLLVTSATYRQSSRVETGAAARDPDNRLLARGPRVRLTAEMVRDQALTAGGLLSPKMFGPPVRPARPSMGLSAAFGGGLDWQTSTDGDQHRRGLYTEWRRTSPYPSMTTFDAPNRETCTLRRDRSNTPLQALVLMNDPVFVEAAQGLARVLTVKPSPPAQIIAEGFRRVLSRQPSATEQQRLLRLHGELLGAYRQDAKKAAEMATNPIGPLPAGTDAAELATWTAVAGVLLNLDETLMKR